METVLLFLVLLSVGAYLTYRTAPMAVRREDGGELLHLLASSGVWFIVFVLSIFVSGILAFTVLLACTLFIYTGAYLLYRQKMKEHDPDKVRQQFASQTVMENNHKITFVENEERIKRRCYQKWFRNFNFRFLAFCIIMLLVRIFTVH